MGDRRERETHKRRPKKGGGMIGIKAGCCTVKDRRERKNLN